MNYAHGFGSHLKVQEAAMLAADLANVEAVTAELVGIFVGIKKYNMELMYIYQKSMV